MRKTILLITGLLTSTCFGFFINQMITNQTDSYITRSNQNTNQEIEDNMKLGAFSVSLSVKDLKTSKEFYENLGFTTFAGDFARNYLIMKNEHAIIGLFQGMFEGNILTFNPGWDENAQNVDPFDDVREIQRQLKGKDYKFISEADEKTSGPASLMMKDPDGNLILVDQHR